MTPDEILRIENRLEKIEEHQINLLTEVGIIKSKVHTPLDCPFAKDIDSLNEFQTRQKGALWIVGLIGGFIVAIILKGIDWVLRIR